ncbi:MAG: sugar transferase, partial [Parcubacteria group bacterium]|nr:sugar transferase [Parcubacteria group bacterium]
ALKRAIDVIGSLAGILLFSPFMLPAALAVKLEDGGPVFVRLNRVSSGKVVGVFKFRSMVENAHDFKPILAMYNERRDGPFFKIKDDPRVTKTGKILRKFKLDELPQFFNVLTGDLSLVGPRPHEPEEVIHYPGRFKNLIMAKTGMTGLSQVNGASNLPFLTELALDAYYAKNQSLFLDLKILAKTAYLMLFDYNGV